MTVDLIIGGRARHYQL